MMVSPTGKKVASPTVLQWGAASGARKKKKTGLAPLPSSKGKIKTIRRIAAMNPEDLTQGDGLS